MDARDLLLRLVARWPLVLGGFLVSLVIGAGIFLVTPASYTATAAALVVPPSTDPGTNTPVNPLTSLDSVVQVASTLVYAAQSPSAVGQIADASNDGSAQVVNTGSDPTINTPYIQITGSGESAADATNAAQAAIRVMGDQLSTIQNNSDVPTFLKMRLVTVNAPVVSTASGSARLKAAGLAAGIALVVALVAVAVTDRVLLARQRRDSTPPTPSRPRRRPGSAEPENRNETTQVISRGLLPEPEPRRVPEHEPRRARESEPRRPVRP